jgi:hypothetical protein
LTVNSTSSGAVSILLSDSDSDAALASVAVSSSEAEDSESDSDSLAHYETTFLDVGLVKEEASGPFLLPVVVMALPLDYFFPLVFPDPLV